MIIPFLKNIKDSTSFVPIAKRYRRGDAIGIPYAITVDDVTLEQGTVTVRDRDTMEQKVIHVEELISFLMEK